MRLRALWLSTLLVALLALTWQSFIVQTHVHARPDGWATGLAANAASSAQLETGQSAPDVPTPCPICQEIAHAGSYLVPSLPAFHLPQPVIAWYAVSPSLTIAPRQRSHAWQSRAPPHQLQA
jgi:hypothetical protein